MISGGIYNKDFQYLIEKERPAKICFGSGRHRKTKFAEIKSIFKVSPASYDFRWPKKPESKWGSPGIANRAKRTLMQVHSITPGPGKYNVDSLKPASKSKAPPFNSSVMERDAIKIADGPGPTVYNAHKVKKCKRTRFDYDFGKPSLVPYVEMTCINYPTEACKKCGVPFEYGDFWHRNYAVYLCTLCMAEEHRLHDLYSKKELLQFKKIRTCTFMHRHELTSAKIRIMQNKDIIKKIRLENYLSQYLQCYGTKSKTELNVPYNDVM